MANWTIRLATQSTRVDWFDSPAGDQPTRINPDGVPHRYIQVHTGRLVVLEAVVDVPGVLPNFPIGQPSAAPEDDNFDPDEVWTWWLLESPGFPHPPISASFEQSSRARFTPRVPGHYTVMAYWAGHGRVVLHFDAITPPVDA